MLKQDFYQHLLAQRIFLTIKEKGTDLFIEMDYIEMDY